MNGLAYLERLQLLDSADEFEVLFKQLMRKNMGEDKEQDQLWIKAWQILPNLLRDIKS